MTWTWVEPFAGAAACALRLVGGAGLAPPVAWMGGKRRLAAAILGAMGVPEGRPARVLLADAGPWGWVWPLLLEASSAAAVARVLRSWSGEHPRDLWQRLAAQPPAEDLHERAAQWLWLQARSASGVPIWWDGWRATCPEGPARVRSTWDRYGESNGGRWKASDGRGVERPAGARAVGGRWENGRTGGMVFPGTIADRVEAIALAFAGVTAKVHHGDARNAGPGECSPFVCRAAWIDGVTCAEGECDREAGGRPRPAFVFLDPPYVGATGYGWDCPRAEVLALARRWADAGAVVAVSEAVPLDLEGWHHVDLTMPGGKPEWLTLSRPAVRLPERQRALFGGP